MLRQTHTFATLPISKAAFDEIKAKLTAVQYDHTFTDVGGVPAIDMHGIGLVAEDPVDPLLRMSGPDADGAVWLHVNPKSGPKCSIVFPALHPQSICLRSVTNALAEQN